MDEWPAVTVDDKWTPLEKGTFEQIKWFEFNITFLLSVQA